MLTLDFAADQPLRVLCIGAHSDDIEIGCGGTLMTLMRREGLHIDWVVCSGSEKRQEEACHSAADFLGDTAHTQHFGTFRDGFFPYQGGEVKDFFESLKASIEPDVIFVHDRNDLHQDHRLLAELARNTWSDHLILKYEIVKYDGDLGQPHAYVALERDVVDRKIAHLMKHFGSQRSKQWFDEETFRGLMRIRGVECNSPSGYAEAFYARKMRMFG